MNTDAEAVLTILGTELPGIPEVDGILEHHHRFQREILGEVLEIGG